MRRKWLAVGGICLFLILLCSILFANDDNKKTIIQGNSNNYVAINDLKEEYDNPDIIGAINILGTDISEILVQGEDNDYYLNHNLYNLKDVKGATFLDYRINLDSKKILIYGHNSSSLEVPFKELENYYDEEFYEKHKYIEIVTNKKVKKYEIFSVYVETSNWDYMNIDFENEIDWYNHLKELNEKSWYDTGVDVSENDEVLILQTCSHHKDYKNYDKKYLLIIARGI